MHMKKFFLLFALIMSSAFMSVWSQLMPEKLPYSFINPDFEIITPTINITPLSNEQIIEKLKLAKSPELVVGILQNTSITFPESGTILTTPEGSKIWRVKITLPNSQGLGLYFDDFQLPQGVEMFLYNENKKQLRGTYSYMENKDDKTFATGPIQGNSILLELNIQQSVDINKINLHINQIGVYFKNISNNNDQDSNHGQRLGEIAEGDKTLSNSVCMINSNCSLSSGYDIQSRATVMTIIDEGIFLYACTGVLINTANNSPASCTRYVLTASSCEINNVITGSTFSSKYVLRFNYNSESCEDNSGTFDHKEITGVSFVSRSDFPSEYITSPETKKGDFLLLKITTPIPTSWNVTLAGYNAGVPETMVTSPDKLLTFFHPENVKKVATFTKIEDFDAGDVSSHWIGITDSGLVRGLGAPLFDKNKRIIGISSFWTPKYLVDEECFETPSIFLDTLSSREMKFSKLSYNWTNPGDDGSSIRVLNEWLDPDADGTLVTDPLNSDCTPLSSSSKNMTHLFDSDFRIYPNPSYTGEFEIELIVQKEKKYNLEVIDITGKIVFKSSFENISNNSMILDLKHLNTGLYVVKLSNEYGSTSQKILIQK